MQLIFVENFFKDFRKVLDYSLIDNHPQRDIILKRIEIIDFLRCTEKKQQKKPLK